LLQKKTIVRTLETKIEKNKLQDQQGENERKKKEEAIQEKLKEIGQCEAGYDWIKVQGGWQCLGGSHSVSDKELEKHFSF
jgi:hypothetical protein